MDAAMLYSNDIARISMNKIVNGGEYIALLGVIWFQKCFW